MKMQPLRSQVHPDMIRVVSISTALILLISLGACLCVNETARVRIIATGKTSAMPVFRGWLLSEPSIGGTIMPSRTEGRGDMSVEEVRKFMRIYFPRTFEELLTYDFLFLAQVDMTFYTAVQDRWMHDAILEHGLGGINTRSIMSMNPIWSEPWLNSVLSDAFPNDVRAVIGTLHHHKASGRIKVNEDPGLPPLVGPYREALNRLPAFQGILTIPKPGSRVYTWLMTTGAYGLPAKIPHLFEWDYGAGRTFTALDMLYNAFWHGKENEYSLDIVANLIWRGSGLDLPSDAMLVHFLRKKMQSFSQDKAFLISIFDFIERFNANTDGLYAELEETQGRKAEVDRLYMMGEFERSDSAMKELQEELGDLSEKAMAAKDAALRWVYFIEWAAVIGTCLASGSAIWLLMVRRTVYREVGATRSDRDRLESRRYTGD